MGTPRKTNTILLSIKINRPKLVNINWQHSGKTAKFHGNILNLSENIAKSFCTFLTHTVYAEVLPADMLQVAENVSVTLTFELMTFKTYQFSARLQKISVKVLVQIH